MRIFIFYPFQKIPDCSFRNSFSLKSNNKLIVYCYYRNVTIRIIQSGIFFQKILNFLFPCVLPLFSIRKRGMEHKLCPIPNLNYGTCTRFDIHRQDFGTKIGINKRGLTAFCLSGNHQAEFTRLYLGCLLLQCSKQTILPGKP